MTTRLASASFLRSLDRYRLTQFLERCRDWLSPSGAALLARNGELNYEAWCAAWGAEFKGAGAYAAPLREALEAIERLALPENEGVLREAISHLPPEFTINRGFPAMNQAIHLWLIAHGRPEVVFPIQVGKEASTDNGAGGTVVEGPGGPCGEQGARGACVPEADRADRDEGEPAAERNGVVEPLWSQAERLPRRWTETGTSPPPRGMAGLCAWRDYLRLNTTGSGRRRRSGWG